MAYNQNNLDKFVQKLLEVQHQESKEMDEETLQYIASQMGVAPEDLDAVRKAYWERAQTFLQYKNWEDAKKQLEQLIILSPKNADAYFGMALVESGLAEENRRANPANALKFAYKALEINPNHKGAASLISRLKNRDKQQTNLSQASKVQYPNNQNKNFKQILFITTALIVLMVAGVSMLIFSRFSDKLKEDVIENTGLEATSSSIPSFENVSTTAVGFSEGKPLLWVVNYEQTNDSQGIRRDFMANIVNPITGEVLQSILLEKDIEHTQTLWRNSLIANNWVYSFDTQEKTFVAYDFKTGELRNSPEMMIS